jgi:RNA polymerase sigma factor (sigma-70 family)
MALCQPDSDTRELESLLTELRPRIRATFGRFRIPPEEAEDILQDSLLALVSKGAAIHSREPWLLATLRNRCLLYWRSRRRRLYDAIDSSLLESAAGCTAPEQERIGLQRDLDAVISLLPVRCQSLLRLRYGLGYDSSEVATSMGYRNSSVRKVALRCISALTRRITAAGICAES